MTYPTLFHAYKQAVRQLKMTSMRFLHLLLMKSRCQTNSSLQTSKNIPQTLFLVEENPDPSIPSLEPIKVEEIVVEQSLDATRLRNAPTAEKNYCSTLMKGTWSLERQKPEHRSLSRTTSKIAR